MATKCEVIVKNGVETGKVAIFGLENRDIIYRNFTGRVDRQYNPMGRRLFTIVLDPMSAQVFQRKGYNVKVAPPKDDGEEPTYTLKVGVRFDLNFAKPRIGQFKRGRKVPVDEGNIANFDNATFEEVNLVVRPYTYIDRSTGKDKISAQVDEMSAYLASGVLEELWDLDDGPAEDDSPFGE